MQISVFLVGVLWYSRVVCFVIEALYKLTNIIHRVVVLHYYGPIFKIRNLRIVLLVLSYLIFDIFTIGFLYHIITYLLIYRKGFMMTTLSTFCEYCFFCSQKSTFCSVEACTTMILFKLYLLHMLRNVYVWDLLWMNTVVGQFLHRCCFVVSNCCLLSTNLTTGWVTCVCCLRRPNHHHCEMHNFVC